MLEWLGKVPEGDGPGILVSLLDYFTIWALLRVFWIIHMEIIVWQQSLREFTQEANRTWAHIMLQYYENNFLLGSSRLSQTQKSTKTALSTSVTY